MTTIARGERGHVADTRSITAQKYFAGLEAKKGLDEAIRRSKNDLNEKRVKVVTLPDGRAFAIPRDVYDTYFEDDDD